MGNPRARLLEVLACWSPNAAGRPVREYELLVDAELGLLHRVAERGPGEEGRLWELGRLIFDAPLHPAAFVFAPRPQP